MVNIRATTIGTTAGFCAALVVGCHRLCCGHLPVSVEFLFICSSACRKQPNSPDPQSGASAHNGFPEEHLPARQLPLLWKWSCRRVSKRAHEPVSCCVFSSIASQAHVELLETLCCQFRIPGFRHALSDASEQRRRRGPLPRKIISLISNCRDVVHIGLSGVACIFKGHEPSSCM